MGDSGREQDREKERERRREDVAAFLFALQVATTQLN